MKGFSNISENLLTHDFKVCFNNISYKISRFFADFISPKIAKIHKTDPLASEISIPIEDPEFLFEKILSMFHGDALFVCDYSFYFFYYVFAFLENDEAISMLDTISKKKITTNNALITLINKTKTFPSRKKLNSLPRIFRGLQ